MYTYRITYTDSQGRMGVADVAGYNVRWALSKFEDEMSRVERLFGVDKDENGWILESIHRIK